VKRALAVTACALIFAAPAVAATSRDVRALAHAAASSPTALAQLRSIRVVDGKAFDLGRVLRTSDRAELRSRLRALSSAGGAPAPFAAKSEARRVLHERRFRGSAVPRPFHGALVWLGEKFRPVTHAVERLARRIPGGAWTVWIVLAAIVIAASAALAGKTARRRGALEIEQLANGPRQARLDPRQLEREADEAEAAGDAARALRLRFRAGLLRLGRARVVPLRASLTSGEARRIIRLSEFDALARTHDEVVYGGRSAVSADLVAARERWPRILEAKGVRS
jgi:hypothetical protein